MYYAIVIVESPEKDLRFCFGPFTFEEAMKYSEYLAYKYDGWTGIVPV